MMTRITTMTPIRIIHICNSNNDTSESRVLSTSGTFGGKRPPNFGIPPKKRKSFGQV